MFKNPMGLILTIVLAGLVSCASKPKEINKTAQIYFNAGTSSLMNKEYTEALTNMLKANELAPNNPDILNNLGMAYYFKGDTDLALKALTLSLKINPKNSDARTNLGSIYYQSGRFQEAETHYKEVLKDLTYDKQARTYYNLGIISLEQKKDPKQAETYFNLSLKEAEDYCPAHYKLGSIAFAKRDFNKAYRSFREATMGTCLNSAAAHYQQAMAMIELRRFSDARMKLDEVENRFKNSTYAVKARTKMLELDELQRQYKSIEASSPRKVTSPEY
ncbi:MAG: tetratricopeptide repeat protein [Bdellovibrionota bacterium]